MKENIPNDISSNSNSNENSIFYYKRYTKKPYFFQRDDEILYLYRNFIFNERINDRLNLDYDIEDHNNSDNIFNLYPNLPTKLSYYKLWKYRKPIRNFIIYQYSIKGKTFVERKLLKEAKKDVCHIFEKKHNYLIFTSTFTLALFTRSKPIFASYLFLLYLNSTYEYLANLDFFFNYNDILMKYQVNTNYKLGRETEEFVKYLNSNLNEKLIANKKYYDKFFVNDVYDLKFEADDVLFDYLANYKYNINFHQEYLKKLEMERQNKNTLYN